MSLRAAGTAVDLWPPVGPRARPRAADAAALARYARDLAVDLVVLSDEWAIFAGASEACRAMDVPCFGPSAAAASFERRRSTGKQLLQRAGLPTPVWAKLADDDAVEAFASELGAWCVVKRDRHCGPTDVTIAPDPPTAREVATPLLAATADGDGVIVERFVDGVERSFQAWCDGERCVVWPPLRAYKHLHAGDFGPMTGGMGAVAAVPPPQPAAIDVAEQLFAPLLRTLRDERTPYVGALTLDAIFGEDGVSVIDVNCHMGDPETPALLSLVREPIAPIMLAAAGSHGIRPLSFSDEHAVAVTLAGSRYMNGRAPAGAEPDVAAIPRGHGIFISDAVLHGLRPSESRVASVVGTGPTIGLARAAAYDVVRDVVDVVPQLRFRTDIGQDVEDE